MNAYLTYDRIDDRRWVEQQLTDEKDKWIDDRAKEIISLMPKDASGFFLFSVPVGSTPYAGLLSDKAGETYNDFISAVAYAQAEHDWEHRTGCPF
ncbi:host nuclease inhibitor GamL [Huaxiibacter chinensis]